MPASVTLVMPSVRYRSPALATASVEHAQRGGAGQAGHEFLGAFLQQAGGAAGGVGRDPAAVDVR